jgi:hypothetical protein
MQAPRRQFAVALAFVLLGGAAVVTGCGSSPTSPTSPQSTGTPASVGSLYGTVSENHPMAHVAMITAAQLSAGVGITLDISNGSHSHTVNITDADMREIAAKGRVSVTSSQNPHSDGSGAHRHSVTFN